MGVRGLQSFIEQNCPDACKFVTIKQLADEHRDLCHCQPVLVVDGMAMLNRLYTNSALEWIYGGQWLQFVSVLENFISKFKSIGVKLIFFFDGTISASKRDEWVRRRVSKYHIIASIFRGIKINFTEPDKKLFQLPTSTGTLARFAVKELGAEVYQTVIEADDVIVEYANNHKEVFGILSQDSDFVIYNTKMYLSLAHLDLNSLQTIHYDRNCFALQYLRLQVNQLPLFACLSGNDFVPSEKLREFHLKFSKNGRIHMSAMASNLASVIKLEKWTGDLTNEQELKRISLLVFGHARWSELIRDGLKSYAVGNCESSPTVCVRVHPDFEKAVYERHINCSNVFIFNLLCKMEYESSEVLEDVSNSPTALIYREIRQRCYGVLFNCFLQPNYNQGQMLVKNGDTIIIKEWCAYHGNNMERPELIKPLPLKAFCSVEDQILSIEELWFNCSELKKMRLFWSILQVPMEFEVLLTLPKHLIVPSCILNYLIGGLKSGSLLKPWEVAVFIAQALWRKSVIDLQRLAPPWVDAAAVNLSTLFMRGVTTVLMVFSSCDFPFPLTYAMPWHFFDGKLFHHLYVKAKQRPNIHELCGNQVETIKEFYNLLPAVTNNTVYDVNRIDWRNILESF